VDLDALTKTFGSLTLGLVPTRGVGADLRRGDGKPVVPRDLDLLLLGDLLPEVDRVALLPIDALVEDDVAALADLDLAGHAFAAPSVAGARGTSGFGVIHGAGLRLQARTAASTELRRRAYGRHAFDFDAFTTDVMVLDLARMRADKLVADYLPYVEEFGLSWREILHLAAGPDRAVVPARWHWVPTRTVVEHPALVHWADPVKPWDAGYVPEQERWLEAKREA
jgi:lipopolysaccharide biosynthesis glycosyltransferase